MSATIELPLSANDPQITHINVYKKNADQAIYIWIAQVPIGTETYTDPYGDEGDSYYTTFYDSYSGVEGEPGPIVLVTDHIHTGSIHGIVIELPVTSTDSRVTHINLYRRKSGEILFTSISTIVLGIPSYKDTNGIIGDEYYTTFLDSSTGLESQPGPILKATEAITPEVVVSGILIDATRGPIVNSTVSAELIHPTATVMTYGVLTIANYAIEKVTDSSGSWAVSLLPNDMIYPSGSFYRFRFYYGNEYRELSSKKGFNQTFSALRAVKSLLQR